jgi:phosphoribosylpyrophosphate synthetase
VEDFLPVFCPDFAHLNDPRHVVTLGNYYPQTQIGPAKDLLREVQAGYVTDADARRMQEGVQWTRWIAELNKERQWPLKRLFERLNPMLASGIALAVVPSHDPFHFLFPIRTLAQRLAAENERIDATACLIRHTRIKRILFGGPSTRALHRETISVEHAELIQGRSVLLLDDIAKSGASLMACRQLLLEAGASVVQPLALGRVIVSRDP